jgi:hypothetical protein
MGLDLFHLRANADRRGAMIVIEPIAGSSEMKRKFRWCTEVVHTTHIDWDATFAARGLKCGHYQSGEWMVRATAGDEIQAGCYSFARRGDADNGVPEQVLFVNTEDEAELEVNVLRKCAKPVLFHGPLSTHRVADLVVFAERLGYQRKSVENCFFEEFPPSAFLTDVARLQRIHALTHPAARPGFKRRFLDNWDRKASFGLVSW